MYYVKAIWYLTLMQCMHICSNDTVSLSFTRKPLIPLLSQVSPQGTMIMLPQNAADLDELRKQQVTYLSREQTAPKSTAWSILKTFLELSGFSGISKDNRFVIVRNKSVSGGAANREAVPVYAGVIPDTLTPDDTRIRYIHYLRNLTVPTKEQKNSHALSKMLQEMLSQDASLLFDTASNAIIMTDKTSHLIAIARLLNEFDNLGLKEEVAYIPLQYLPAKEIETILNSLKIAAGDSARQGRKFIRSDPQADSFMLFSQDTRVVADSLHNGIILMGRKANVERISKFIQNSLDVAPQTGESILHYYNLQYLDAEKFAPILARIVSSVLPEGVQATQEAKRPFFQGVAVAAEETGTRENESRTQEIDEIEKSTSDAAHLENLPANAGNRLIIAARQKDWNVIEKLIKKLDQPQPQVVLEVLIVEFTYDKRAKVAGSIRSKTGAPLLREGVEYLASHLTSVNSVLGNNPVQLAEDLLQVVGPDSVANQIGPGSLLLSINDTKTPGILGLLEILERVLTAKISSHPFITITNNQQGVIDATETRRTTGDLSTSTDGSLTIPIEDVTASINVTAIPHIVSDNKLRLSLSFKIEQFTGAQFNRLTRELKTTATLNSGEILAMGGLIRADTRTTGTLTPILGNIPLLGAFFRNTEDQIVRTNITLFVMPTIIGVRKLGPWINRTRDLVNDYDVEVSKPQRPSDMRDPLYRLFFDQPKREISRFMEQGATVRRITPEAACEPKLLQTDALKKKPQRTFDPLKLKQVLYQKTRPTLPLKQRSSYLLS